MVCSIVIMMLTLNHKRGAETSQMVGAILSY